MHPGVELVDSTIKANGESWSRYRGAYKTAVTGHLSSGQNCRAGRQNVRKQLPNRKSVQQEDALMVLYLFDLPSDP